MLLIIISIAVQIGEVYILKRCSCCRGVVIQMSDIPIGGGDVGIRALYIKEVSTLGRFLYWRSIERILHIGDMSY